MYEFEEGKKADDSSLKRLCQMHVKEEEEAAAEAEAEGEGEDEAES